MKAVCIILLATSVAVYFTACTKDKALESTSCLIGIDSVHYSLDIVPILTTKCTDPAFGDCHFPGAFAAIDLTTYDAIKIEIENGKFETFVLGPTASMPKSITLGPTSLTACEKEKLQVWIDQGHKEN